MGWERRGRYQVYYRAKKVAGRVVRTHFGRGPRAEQAAAEDAARRAEREARAREWRRHRERLDAAEDAVKQFCSAVQAVVAAHLRLGGYYRDARGQWRRRRRK